MTETNGITLKSGRYRPEDLPQGHRLTTQDALARVTEIHASSGTALQEAERRFTGDLAKLNTRLQGAGIKARLDLSSFAGTRAISTEKVLEQVESSLLKNDGTGKDNLAELRREVKALETSQRERATALQHAEADEPSRWNPLGGSARKALATLREQQAAAATALAEKQTLLDGREQRFTARLDEIRSQLPAEMALLGDAARQMTELRAQVKAVSGAISQLEQGSAGALWFDVPPDTLDAAAIERAFSWEQQQRHTASEALYEQVRRHEEAFGTMLNGHTAEELQAAMSRGLPIGVTLQLPGNDGSPLDAPRDNFIVSVSLHDDAVLELPSSPLQSSSKPVHLGHIEIYVRRDETPALAEIAYSRIEHAYRDIGIQDILIRNAREMAKMLDVERLRLPVTDKPSAEQAPRYMAQRGALLGTDTVDVGVRKHLGANDMAKDMIAKLTDLANSDAADQPSVTDNVRERAREHIAAFERDPHEAMAMLADDDTPLTVTAWDGDRHCTFGTMFLDGGGTLFQQQFHGYLPTREADTPPWLAERLERTLPPDLSLDPQALENARNTLLQYDSYTRAAPESLAAPTPPPLSTPDLGRTENPGKFGR